MKRIFTLASLLFAFGAVSYAQGEMDAFNLSYNELTGTARSVAMGGAFGALGGDISGVAINPAGIGVYKSHEIATTINFTNTKSETNLLGSKNDVSKFNFTFDNIGIVGAVPLYSDEVPLLNFGFSYNKLKSFDRKFSTANVQTKNSMTDYIANRANNVGYDNIVPQDAYDYGDWMSILGYDGGLAVVDKNTKKFSSPLMDNESVMSRLHMREKGDISSYDFNIGTTIADVVSIGATISMTDINYHLYSEYAEDFLGSGQDEGFILENHLKTDGTGWQVKAGVIFKPVNELRIGVAYHSPTWYNMTDSYFGEVIADYYVDNAWDRRDAYTPKGAFTDYKFRTPDKWVFSLAGVIGQYAIISADYELTNYSNMTFKDYDGYKDAYIDSNDAISTDFKNSSVIRVGAEIRFTPQFSGRIGYMWQQSPVDDKLKDGSESGAYTAATVGTIPHYSLMGDANNFTWGLGYRFTPKFYTDVAFIIKTRTDDLYSFGGADKAELKTNQFSGLLTLGYRF